jgi:hypothetical protein
MTQEENFLRSLGMLALDPEAIQECVACVLGFICHFKVVGKLQRYRKAVFRRCSVVPRLPR